MNVLLKNLPIGIRDHELAELIKSNFNASTLENSGLSLSVDGIIMLEIQDNFTRPIEQFGLVRISSSQVAKEVIKQLDSRVFNEHKITVREYYSRSASNDPRLPPHKTPKDFIEKRVQDRRKITLVHSRRV